jgi:hypothetical protein
MDLRTPLTPPRHFISAPSVTPLMPGAGLPHDRHTRVAAQRSFIDLRQQFIDAVQSLDDGYRNRWLLRQVSQAQDPVDLWLMRSAVFTSLQTLGQVSDRAINTLERALEQVFPDGGQLQPLPPLLR